MWNKIFGKTLRSQLIRYNIAIICIIDVFINAYAYTTSNRRIVEMASTSLEHNVESISNQYQVAYDEMMNVILNCTERELIDFDTMSSTSEAKRNRLGLEYVQILKDYCTVIEYGKYISRLIIFDNKGNRVQAGALFGSNDDMERLKSAPWLQTECEKSIEMYPLQLVDAPFFQKDGDILPIARKITRHQKKTQIYTVLCISSALYRDVLRQDTSGHEILVATESGQKIASIGERADVSEENDALMQQLLSAGREKGIEKLNVHGEECLVGYEKNLISGILVCEIMPLRELLNDRLMLIEAIVLMFMASLFFGIVLSVLLSRKIDKPIRKLMAHISRIAEGEFERDPSIESEDEIGQVGKIINDMSGKIDTLMTEQIETEKEKGSLELKMLQAQINPHFLYNTLDSIRWIAVIQKNSGIVKIVTALSGLLKNMAKGFNEKITLRKELDFLQDYVTIEKMKYVEMFDLEVVVEEERLYEARMIKLTLQPLVENAIFNGIEPAGKPGLISIYVGEDAGVLKITVRDNGVGIPEEKLKTILEHTEKVKSSSMSGIGLPNVDRRIKLYYGENYGLRIRSEVGKFTEITVEMPLEFAAPQEFED